MKRHRKKVHICIFDFQNSIGNWFRSDCSSNIEKGGRDLSDEISIEADSERAEHVEESQSEWPTFANKAG